MATRIEQEYNTLTNGSFNFDITDQTLVVQSINENDDISLLPNGQCFSLDLKELPLLVFAKMREKDESSIDNKPRISIQQATNMLVKMFTNEMNVKDAFYETIQNLRNTFIDEIENKYTILGANGEICNQDHLNEEDFGDNLWYDDTLEECVETATETLNDDRF